MEITCTDPVSSRTGTFHSSVSVCSYGGYGFRAFSFQLPGCVQGSISPPPPSSEEATAPRGLADSDQYKGSPLRVPGTLPSQSYRIRPLLPLGVAERAQHSGDHEAVLFQHEHGPPWRGAARGPDVAREPDSLLDQAARRGLLPLATRGFGENQFFFSGLSESGPLCCCGAHPKPCRPFPRC